MARSSVRTSQERVALAAGGHYSTVVVRYRAGCQHCAADAVAASCHFITTIIIIVIMPRIFMLTHRRYVPTPPVNNVLNHSPDDRATVADERMVENSSDVRREEQEEAVDLVVHKVTDDSTSFTGNRGSNDCYDSRCTAFDQFKYSNDPTVYHGAAAHSPLFTVKAGGHGNSYIVEDGHDDSAVDDRRNSRNETSNTIPTSSSDNGMDLSMKGELNFVLQLI